MSTTISEEPLDTFHIHTVCVFGWWDRVKILLGKQPYVRLELPVYPSPLTGGLTGKAQSSVGVPPLIRPRMQGYAAIPEAPDDQA